VLEGALDFVVEIGEWKGSEDLADLLACLAPAE
jgi:hypothetical protein